VPLTEGHRLTRLENGVRILTEEVPGMRSVSIGIWVENGSRHEEPAQAGTSHFLEHLLFKGTARRTAKEISQAIEDVGGVLNAFTGKETTCYYAKVLDGDLPLAVDLLTDVFLSATLPSDEFVRERDVIVQEILHYEDSPDELVHDLFARAFWPDHSLGRPIAGSVESVMGLDCDMLRAFMRERYRAQRILIAAAGAVGHDALVAATEEEFGRIPAVEAGSGQGAPVATGGVRVTRKPLEQAHVCLGFPAMAQDDPDRYAAQMLNVALGGGMSSRLFQRIREERGRAYSVYSFLNAFSDCGYLGVYAGTSPEWVPEVVALIEETIDDVRRDGLEAREIERARTQLKASLLLGLEASDNRMSRLARGCLVFGRLVGVEEICASLDAVTADDVARVADRIGAADGRHLTVLGDIDEAAVGLG
jgi:predicted Zn-dependent peptidase